MDLEKVEKPALNVVVSNSILPPVLFWFVVQKNKRFVKLLFACFSDVLNYGMKKCETLPRLDMTNIFTCLDVYDIDFDGRKEILIGNSTEVNIFYFNTILMVIFFCF